MKMDDLPDLMEFINIPAEEIGKILCSFAFAFHQRGFMLGRQRQEIYPHEKEAMEKDFEVVWRTAYVKFKQECEKERTDEQGKENS